MQRSTSHFGRYGLRSALQGRCRNKKTSARSGMELLKLGLSHSTTSVPREAIKATKALRAAVLRRAVSLAAPGAGSAAGVVADTARRHEPETSLHHAKRQVP
jgi:hypothetical protein